MTLLWRWICQENELLKCVKLYKCGNCGKQFLDGTRISNEIIWSDYVFGKQAYAQLAEKYSCSIKTVKETFRSNFGLTEREESEENNSIN